jgi:hypothetical protein
MGNADVLGPGKVWPSVAIMNNPIKSVSERLLFNYDKRGFRVGQARTMRLSQKGDWRISRESPFF